MKLLDLFCCCGGAAKGFRDNGFEVTGVDITDNHDYPYDFIHQDVFDLPADFFQQFDLIWASPPCQHYSWSTKVHRNKGKEYVDLVEPTRQLLTKIGKPFIIENVVGAPIRNDLRLCGEMFGLRLTRHRIFEFHHLPSVLQPPHIKHRPLLPNGKSYYINLAGHGGNSYSFKMEDWKKAIEIDWIRKPDHLTQAIPPRYTDYICKNLGLYLQPILGNNVPSSTERYFSI